jgi:hypothetical protein
MNSSSFKLNLSKEIEGLVRIAFKHDQYCNIHKGCRGRWNGGYMTTTRRDLDEIPPEDERKNKLLDVEE